MPWVWAKVVKVAKEIGSEGKKKKKSSSFLSSTLMLLTQGLPLLPATIYYHKEMKLEWEVYVFAHPVCLVCPMAHAASLQCCNKNISPRWSLVPAPEHVTYPPSPPLVRAIDEAALSYKICFLYLNEEGLQCFRLEGGGRRTWLCPWSSASRSFALIVSEVIAATVFLLLLLGALCLPNRQFHLPELLIQGTC